MYVSLSSIRYMLKYLYLTFYYICFPLIDKKCAQVSSSNIKQHSPGLLSLRSATDF